MSSPISGSEFFAVETEPELGWDGVPTVDLATLQEVPTITPPDEESRLFASDISNHHSGLRDASGRLFAPCPEGQPIPLELVSASLGLVRAVVDTRTIIHKGDEAWKPRPRLGQGLEVFAATVRAMNSDATYSGTAARVMYREDNDTKLTVVTRQVVYGHARGDNLGVVSSGSVERAREQHLGMLPGDMAVGRVYEQQLAGHSVPQLTRIAGAVIMVRSTLPRPRTGD